MGILNAGPKKRMVIGKEWDSVKIAKPFDVETWEKEWFQWVFVYEGLLAS